MLTIQQIINEADPLVPNVIPTADKIAPLNAINRDFFNQVKISKIARFATSVSSAAYTLPTDVREKNIDYVQIGLLRYRSLDSEAVTSLDNTYSFDDTTRQLTLSPAPYTNGLQGICRYYRIATTTFTNANLSVVPDAPEEYHWTYVQALAAWIANAMDDATKAANYEAQYRAAWQAAAQDFAGAAGR